MNIALGSKSTAIEALRGIDLTGKVAIVTGGNSGIGLETVGALAYAGCKVYMTSRNQDAGQKAAHNIKNKHKITKGEVNVRPLDLTKLPTIHSFSWDFLNAENRLDYLILNAGIMASPQSYSDHGFELHMATNHFGHFALTKDLLPKMKSQDFQSRIVVVSSSLHKKGKIDLSDLHYKHGRKYNAYDAYSQSKLANILFANQLAKILEGSSVNAYSLHPGVINTNLSRYMGVMGMLYRMLPMATIFSFMKTVEQGASTTVYTTVADELSGKSGSYLGNCSIETPAESALDMEMAEQLWKVTEEQLAAVEKDLQS
eukprot:TRINITY_DN6059_c1_g1_i1.p1 TRINITY_DN6059_c1_g1~~TRINITY_DN6059_c1_g1_i1.p1  ORF type:complete len:314 (-),score=35.87 TRINITY_DN6059_c1_g1_i1:252-1193(-)